jgi:hypothetical protein
MTLIAEQCRALRLLADTHPSGCPDWLMTYTHGFDVETLLSLTRRGFANARREKMRVGDYTTQVAHLRITEEGRRLLIPLNTDDARRIAVNIAQVTGLWRAGSGD